jgi:hypothetical protein
VGQSDTSLDAQEVQYRVLRAMSPARKVALVEDANRTGRRLAMAGIALRHPEASPEERVRILMDVVLGPQLAADVYGPHEPGGAR